MVDIAINVGTLRSLYPDVSDSAETHTPRGSNLPSYFSAELWEKRTIILPLVS